MVGVARLSPGVSTCRIQVRWLEEMAVWPSMSGLRRGEKKQKTIKRVMNRGGDAPIYRLQFERRAPNPLPTAIGLDERVSVMVRSINYRATSLTPICFTVIVVINFSCTFQK